MSAAIKCITVIVVDSAQCVAARRRSDARYLLVSVTYQHQIIVCHLIRHNIHIEYENRCNIA